MRPQVSIVIPTYKHRNFVVATLESVFAQTIADYEVIVVNDGSPDDTSSVLQPYLATGRIRYLEQVNAGQAGARNRGLAEARGDFIAFLDDDDWWPADKLAWQVEFLRAEPTVGAVAGTALFVSEDGTALQPSPFVPEVTFTGLFNGNPIMSPGQVLIRRSLIQEVGGLDTKIWGADDYDLWFKLVSCSRFLMRDQVALLYRQHAGNATKQAYRLFTGVRQVIDKHLPAASPFQRQLRRSGYNYLQRYWGTSMVWSARRDLRRLDLRGAARHAAAYASIWRGATDHPALACKLLRDLVPLSLR